MYETHFGFSEKPFELTPDPAFLYLSHEIKETIATLEYAILERRGFVLLVGEPGTGKTTLINALMDSSDDNTRFAYVFNPAFDFNDLLQTVLIEFDLTAEDEVVSKRKAIRKLNEYAISQYEKGKRTVIIVDEAQYLDIETLENLRLLSNLETRKHKLFQLIIAGQPDLERSLSHPQLIQLTQRIGLRRKTKPLDDKDSREYIEHRLKIAGYTGPQLFANRAIYLISQHARGIPRTINILCDSALLIGYAIGKYRIDASMVEEAIEDLKTVAIDQDRQPASEPHEAGKASGDSRPDSLPESQTQTAAAPDDDRGDWAPIEQMILEREDSPTVPKESRRSKRIWQKAFSMHAVGAVLIGFLVINLGIFLFYFSDRENFKALSATKSKQSADSGQQADPPSGTVIEDKLASLFQKIEEIKTSIERKMPGNQQDRTAGGQKGSAPDSKNGMVERKANYKTGSGNEPADNPNYAVVKKGDSLNEIIIREYGKLDEALLSLILRSNPNIKNPDHIVENQVIALPSVSNPKVKKGD